MIHTLDNVRDARLRRLQRRRSSAVWANLWMMCAGFSALTRVVHPNRLLVQARCSKGRYA